MSPFLKWPIAALTLIGSIVGGGLTLATFFGMLTRGLSVRVIPIFLLAGALYALGLAAGVLFAQNAAQRGPRPFSASASSREPTLCPESWVRKSPLATA